jgi:Arc/MetJ family transcription regulator
MLLKFSWNDLLPILLVCIVYIVDTHQEDVDMRTNIVIDDSLMNEALAITGLKTKKEIVEEALKLLIQQGHQAKIRKLRGKLRWEGDLAEMRTDK